MQEKRKKQQIVQVLARTVVQYLDAEQFSFDEIQEIKLRIGKPLIVICNGKEKIAAA